MSDLNTEIKIGADASGVEAGVSKAKKSLASLGDAAKKAGKDAGDGLGSIGAGGDKSAKDVERATKNMQGSLQRLLAEQKAGAKGSREYYEALADTRGISRNAIKPILDQIDAAKSKTLEAKSAAESWQSSLGKMGPMVAAAFSGAAIAGFLGKVVSVQREFDVLNSSLKTVTGSSAAAEREMAWLKDFAKETPFGLAQATQGFVKMKALGLDPTRAALTSFGNTASAMGKDLNQMIEAVADASTGEFERLKEFGIKAKKDGDQVSLTFQGITTTIRNSSVEITKYLENIGNASFGGAMEERAKTLDGTIAALGDTWDELFRTVSSNNVGSLIFDSVTLANGVIEDATTIVRALGGAASDTSKDFGALVAVQGGVATFFETVAVLAANTLYVLRQTGDTMGGVAAGYKAFFSFDFDAVRAIGAEMKANGEAARKEIDATTARILSARKGAGIYASYDTRNASAATDPRRLDLGGSSARPAAPGVDAKVAKAEANKQQSEYDKLIASIKTKITQNEAEIAVGGKLNEAEKLRIALTKEMEQGTRKMTAARVAEAQAQLAQLDASERQLQLSQAQQKFEAARDKEAMAIAGSIQAIHDKAQALEDEAVAYGMGAEAIAALTIERLEEKKATLAGFGASAEVIAQIEAEIEARGRLARASGIKTGLDAGAAENKRALEELNNYLDPAKATSFGDALTSAFEGAGNALAAMVNSLDSYGQKEAEIAKMRANLSAVSDPAERAQKEIALANLSSKAQINAYATMAGAAKGFFKEGSTGYKTLGAVEKAYRATELALAAKNMAIKIGLIGGEVAATTAGQGAMTAASAAGEATRMPAKIAGAFASFMSMMGPFGIPAAIAAFAAVGIMAGGGSSPNTLPATNDGTGTVFGDASAKSESIEKTIDLLEGISKFAGIENSYASKMLASLRSIEQQIGGFTNVILRSGGVDAAGAGVAVGTKSFGLQAGPLDFVGKHLFKSKVSITGQGLYANDATLAQIGAGGLDAGYYADVNKKKKLFGITVSDKNSSNFTRDDEVSRQISLLLTDFADSVKLAAPVLGMSLDTIDASLNDFVVKIGRVDLKDLSGAEIQEKLSAVFGAAGDNIAQAAIPGLEHMQQVGEGYFETLARVASSLSSVNQMFDTLGATLYESSIAGAEASIALAELFGGLENMASVVGDYYEAFYSEEERKKTLQRQLGARFDELGFDMPDIGAPDARDQFRALAEAQDISTEAGRHAYASLLQLAGAFASITTSADDARKELDGLATQLADVFSKLYASIARERANVASSRDAILKPGAMGYDQIAAGIAQAMVSAPDASGVVASQASLSPAYAGLTAAKQNASYWQGIEQTASAGVQGAQKSLGDLDAWFAGVQKSFSDFTAYRDWAWSGAGTWSESMALVPENQRRTAQYAKDSASYNAQRQGASVQLTYQQAAQAAARAELDRFTAQTATYQAQVAAAETAASAAQADYSVALRNYVVDAGKAVDKLGKLREETVRYYEAQKQLADLMVGSATQLRSAAQAMRYGQMDTAQSLAQRQGEFAQSYSLALSTTGATQAGYADKMAALLPEIGNALMETSATSIEWALATSKLYAQSQSIAAALEANAPKSYQEESLGLLATIDGSLSAISEASASAEKIISDAIYATGTSNLEGLRAVVAAIRGESIPAFAAGGYHTGGLRLVGERGPELEATGPSRIYSASQTAAMLSGGGNANAELVAEVRALRADNRALQEAMVRQQADMNRLLLRWETQGMPEERVV